MSAHPDISQYSWQFPDKNVPAKHVDAPEMAKPVLQVARHEPPLAISPEQLPTAPLSGAVPTALAVHGLGSHTARVSAPFEQPVMLLLLFSVYPVLHCGMQLSVVWAVYSVLYCIDLAELSGQLPHPAVERSAQHCMTSPPVRAVDVPSTAAHEMATAAPFLASTQVPAP